MSSLFGDFGMSWETGEIDGHRIVQHFGSDEGDSALLLLAPDDNIALVMSSNYFDDVDFNPSAWETATEVMRMILEERAVVTTAGSSATWMAFWCPIPPVVNAVSMPRCC